MRYYYINRLEVSNISPRLPVLKKNSETRPFSSGIKKKIQGCLYNFDPRFQLICSALTKSNATSYTKSEKQYTYTNDSVMKAHN